MGNSLSLSGSKQITGKELQLSSKEISTMSNELFRFMYSSWKPKDVWDIAEHPDKYVIAISDMITTQFHVLGYKTRDKRMGEIYFRRWDDLEPPMGSEQEMSTANSRNDRRLSNIQSSNERTRTSLKKEIADRKKTRRQRAQAGFPIQKQNAEIIAFYFVRIFQILGAMLLVVKDIDLPSYDEKTGEPLGTIGADQTRDFARQRYPSKLTVSGFKSSDPLDSKQKLEYAEASLRSLEEKKKSAVSISTQTGGGNLNTRLALGPYEFLRYYLKTINETDKLELRNNGIDDTTITSNMYMFDKSRILFFKYTPPGEEAQKIDLRNGVVQEIGIPVIEPGETKAKILFIKITVVKLSFNTIKEGFVSELKGYAPPSARGENKNKKEVYPVDVSISYDHIGREKATVTMKRIDTDSGIDTGIPYTMFEADNNLIDAYRGRLDLREDFVEYLEMITLTYLRKKYNGIKLVKMKDKTHSVNENSSETNSTSKFKLKEPSNKSLKDVYSALDNTKGEYRPHCVARALQLLDAASINNFPTGSGSSRICKTSLGKASGQAPLSEYVPTRSLGQLYGKVNPTDYANSMKVLSAFVQKESTGNPISLDDASKFPGEKDELLAAIKRMTTAFNNTYVEQKSFADIKDNIPAECKDDTGKEIVIDRQSQVFRDMKASSQQLMAYHLKSIVDISKFLKKIFNITQRGDGTWKVEGPKVELLFAGYETLDMLTNQARAILIDYYSGCEEIYQRGIGKWKATRDPLVDQSQGKGPVVGAVLPSAPKVVAPVDLSVKPVPQPSRNAGV